MKIRCLLMSLLLVPSLLLAAQKKDNPTPPATAVKAGTTDATGDPFATERNEAAEAVARWRQNNDALRQNLLDSSPCSPEKQKDIAAAQDVGFQAIVLKQRYYADWRNHVRQQAQSYAKALADSATVEAQLQGEANAAQGEFADLKRREQDLRRAAKSHDVSVTVATKHLDQLMATAKARLDTFRQAFANWDQARTYGQKAEQRAEDLLETIRQARLLLGAESGLWQGYYSALTARANLDCAASEHDYFQPFKVDKP